MYVTRNMNLLVVGLPVLGDDECQTYVDEFPTDQDI